MNRRRIPHTSLFTKPEPYSTEEITTILKAVNNSEYIVPILIALCAGTRMRETLALRWSDISFEQNTISVSKQLSRYSREIDVPKSTRTIKMSPHLNAFLAKTKKRQQKDKELACDSWQDNTIQNSITNETETIKDFVNIHQNGVVLTEGSLKYISKVTAQHGIQFHFHKLRHTHINLPVNDEMIQKHLEPILQTL